jgi:uncharacterized protein (TIGR03000 family)
MMRLVSQHQIVEVSDDELVGVIESRLAVSVFDSQVAARGAGPGESRFNWLAVGTPTLPAYHKDSSPLVQSRSRALGVPMWRNLILAASLFACLISAGTFAQEYRKTVTVEVYWPEGARLFIEGQEIRSNGPVRRFVSPPLAPGHYTYTIKAILPGTSGPRTVTRRIDVRPGDFESIDLRELGQRPITDVEYEPTPQEVVDALLRLAKVTSKDVVWDLGCGDGRIPVTAAKDYACKAFGFDIDPERVKDSLANVRKCGVERLVTIEQRDIFTLDLSKGPTIVTLYLLPRLNARLLPQLRKLPPGARIISVAHRMADIKPDERIVVDTELGEFDVYLWKVETLRGN